MHNISVGDVEAADVVEDTSELYIIDTTLPVREKVLKEKTSAEVREILDAMSELDKARTLRLGEEPSQGTSPTDEGHSSGTTRRSTTTRWMSGRSARNIWCFSGESSSCCSKL